MKIINLIAISIMALGLSACSNPFLSYVPAGNVGIKVNKLGSEKGVVGEELSPGRYWLTWNEDLYLFPTFTQNEAWVWNERNDQSIIFQSREGMNIAADIGIDYAVDPNKVSILFQKYRRGIEEISDTFMRNNVKDAFNKVAASKSADEINGSGKEKFIEEVESIVRNSLKPDGINVGNIYLISKLRFPAPYEEALVAKMRALQLTAQRENEILQTKAEALKAIEESKGTAQKNIEEARGWAESKRLRAEAEANANKLIAQSLTPELSNYITATKWDGKLPQTQVSGSGQNTLLNLGMTQK